MEHRSIRSNPLVILRYGASVSQIKPFSSIVIPHYGAPVDIHSLQSIFPNNLSGSLLNSQSSYRYPFKISLRELYFYNRHECSIFMEQFVKSSVEVIVTFMKKVYSHSCKECTR